MNKDANYFSRNLKFLRSMRGLSQKALADELEISRNKIASYESRNIEPNLSLIVKLSAFFKVSIDDLLTLVINQENYNLLNNKYLNSAWRQKEEKKQELKENGYIHQFIQNNDKVTRVYEGLKTYREMMKGNVSIEDMKQMQDIIDFLLDSNKSFIQEVNNGVKNEQ